MRREHIREHYVPRIREDEPGWKILDWASGESQHLRFEALAKHLRQQRGTGLPACADAPCCLLDVGCGTADLSAFLAREAPGVCYTGVDLLPEIVAEAKRRHPDADVAQGDVFDGGVFPPLSFDVVFCSGVFNLELGNNEAFLARALPVLWSLAREAVVVNFLHARAAVKFADCHYYAPDDVTRLCRALTPCVTLDENYLPNDFTVITGRPVVDEPRGRVLS
ncbi:MAG: methyltransferase domain-containing protein [Kiritimatiellaeota bacterium]|nr:methyltransferase domain-containing protein [Kiritimatiellota bacterium]